MANACETNQSNFHETSLVKSESNDRTINSQNQSDISFKTQLQQLEQSYLDQIDLLANQLKEKLKEELTLKLNSKIDEYENEIKLLKKDKDELIIRNAELCEKYEQVNVKQMKVAAQLPIDHNSSDHQYKNRSDSESTELNKSEIQSVQRKTTSRFERFCAMDKETPPLNLKAMNAMMKTLILDNINKNRVFLTSISDTNIAAPILPDIDIINKYDLDVSTVDWQFPCQFDIRDENLLEMYKNLLVDYYRINLTLKYPAEFESYLKGLKPYRPIRWSDLYDKFPADFYSDKFIYQLEEYRKISDDVHLLKKPQFKIMRAMFSKHKLDKNWLDLLEFVDKNFDSIDQHRKKLEKYNLI